MAMPAATAARLRIMRDAQYVVPASAVPRLTAVRLDVEGTWQCCIAERPSEQHESSPDVVPRFTATRLDVEGTWQICTAEQHESRKPDGRKPARASIGTRKECSPSDGVAGLQPHETDVLAARRWPPDNSQRPAASRGAVPGATPAVATFLP